MIKAGALEALHFRIEPGIALCRIAPQDFQICALPERYNGIGRSLTGMFAAISRRTIHMLGEVLLPQGKIGIVPDEMIYAHDEIIKDQFDNPVQ
jgi:hypothetical protein